MYFHNIMAMDIHKQYPGLRPIFDQARVAHPALLGATELVSGGKFGLVAQNGDGTFTKVFFRPLPNMKIVSEAMLHNEEVALRYNTTSNMDGHDVPRLLSDVVTLDSEGVYAAYKMSGVTGQTPDWKAIAKTPRLARYHFESVGAGLAKLHDGLKNFPLAQLNRPAHYIFPALPFGIPQSPELGPDANAALAIVDTYAQQHMLSGVDHGDFGGQNTKINAQGELTGVLDFGTVGRLRNLLCDFVSIPPRFWDHAIKGYEQSSGLKIDKDAAWGAHLCMCIHEFNNTAHAGFKKRVRKTIDRSLSKLSGLTGYKPPVGKL